VARGANRPGRIDRRESARVNVTWPCRSSGDGRPGPQREVEPSVRRRVWGGAGANPVVLPLGRRRPVAGDLPGDVDLRPTRPAAAPSCTVPRRGRSGPVARPVERPIRGGVDPEPRPSVKRLHRERHLVRSPRPSATPIFPRAGARRRGPVERKTSPRPHGPQSPRGRRLLEQHLAAGIGDHPAARAGGSKRPVRFARRARAGAERREKPHRVCRAGTAAGR